MTVTFNRDEIVQLQNGLLEIPAKYSLQILQWLNSKVNEQNPQPQIEGTQEKPVSKLKATK